jgi:hypothetical protein
LNLNNWYFFKNSKIFLENFSNLIPEARHLGIWERLWIRAEEHPVVDLLNFKVSSPPPPFPSLLPSSPPSLLPPLPSSNRPTTA